MAKINTHQANPQTYIRALLNEHGLRYSRPREAILAYFREGAKHVTAESLYRVLKARGHRFSLSTVYLNLGALKQAGVIREFRGNGGEALYDSNIALHYHLICRCCGVVTDLPEGVVTGEAAQRYKGQVETHSGWRVEEPNLNFYGLCPGCQS